MNRVWLVLLYALLGACAPAGQGPTERGSKEPLVWPQPPEQARIQYLYDFREPRDLGLKESFLKRVWGVIAGKEDRRMIKPYAIAVQGQRIAVADPGARALHVFDMASNKYWRISKAGKTYLRSPVGVSLAGDKIYLSDSFLGKVFVFDPEGKHLSTIKGLARPTGLAYDQKGKRLYVAETLGHRIAVFDPRGKKQFAFGKRGDKNGRFNFPSHLFIRGETLYVNDTMNFRLQAFDLQGKYRSSFGKHGDGSGHFAQPKGVGVDAEGHIYVVDALFDRVQIFDPKGRYLLTFGGQGGKAGNFWLPSGLFIAQDRIYVADSYNQRVQVFQFLGGG